MSRWAVVDALGDCYAIRDGVVEGVQAHGEAMTHLYGAVESGHPVAQSWVDERSPLLLLPVGDEEVARLLEQGTPILDCEP